MMNSLVFATEGSWDSTTLMNNDEEVLASRLFVSLRRARGWIGNDRGGEITAYVCTQDEPDDEQGIFPGSIEVRVPRHNILIINRDPHFAFENTQVYYQEIEVTMSVAEFYLEIDADQNIVQCYISLFQGHGIGSGNAETFTSPDRIVRPTPWFFRRWPVVWQRALLLGGRVVRSRIVEFRRTSGRFEWRGSNLDRLLRAERQHLAIIRRTENLDLLRIARRVAVRAPAQLPGLGIPHLRRRLLLQRLSGSLLWRIRQLLVPPGLVLLDAVPPRVLLRRPGV